MIIIFVSMEFIVTYVLCLGLPVIMALSAGAMTSTMISSENKEEEEEARQLICLLVVMIVTHQQTDVDVLMQM